MPTAMSIIVKHETCQHVMTSLATTLKRFHDFTEVYKFQLKKKNLN